MRFFGSLAVVFTLIAGTASAQTCAKLCNKSFLQSATPEQVQEQLDAGEGVNGNGKSKKTPLIMAVYYGASEGVIEFLISKGADVNAAIGNGRTALHFAAQRSSLAVNRILIEAGANPNLKTGIGEPPLNFALNRKEDQFAVIKLYIDAGAEIPSETGSGTPIFIRAAYAGEVEFLEFLLEKNPDFVKYINDGAALRAAVLENSQEVVEWLIEIGSPINAGDREYGETAIHNAAASETSNFIPLLIAAGADVNDRANGGVTPMHVVSCYNLQNLQHLLDAGAEINSKTRYGETPLHYLADFSPAACIEAMIAAGADVNAQENSGLTPLHEAARYQNLDVMRLLIDAGADVNARDKSGVAPIHLSVTNDQGYDATSMLIEAGADPNISNSQEITPLDRAKMYGSCQTINLLLNAETEAKNSDKKYHC